MTLHLTDAQRDTFAACGLIVIDGEQWEYQDERNQWHKGALVAPEGWRILTEPCDTCRGEGHLSRVVGQDPEGIDCYEQRSCPDCVGGRRVVTLTATCPECGGSGIDGDDKDWEPCLQCAEWDVRPGSGVVRLGRFTIPALLPVVKGRSDDGRPPAPYAAVYAEGDVVLVYANVADTCTIRALDPLPRVGQWVVRPEPVTP